MPRRSIHSNSRTGRASGGSVRRGARAARAIATAMARTSCALALTLAGAASNPASAQHGHGAPASDSTASDSSATHAQPAAASHPSSGHAIPEAAPPTEHAMAGAHAGLHAAPALLGPYPIAREASGTSWQPDATPHDAVHAERGAWMLMAHGLASLVYVNQGGARGDRKVVSTNMAMATAQRSLGSRGRFGLRAMLSAEPLTVGREGYPLLLQTGETADGVTPLIDSQHPHDLFMELAATLSVEDATRSAFAYLGFPGEPAIGPPAFMHRYTAARAPEAPISHHWLDSTHITYGVVTLGAVLSSLKLEGSLFTGREPDEDRYGWDAAHLDSHSARLSFNPSRSWSLQASFARIEGPEQLEPDEDVDRTTASAIYSSKWGANDWQWMAAWGKNDARPGPTLDALLTEAAIVVASKHTVFGRYEWVQKDELFLEDHPLAGRVFDTNKVMAGYVYDFLGASHFGLGVGGLVTVSLVPDELETAAYDRDPISGMVFLQALLR
jgi:hypothetical protein